MSRPGAAAFAGIGRWSELPRAIGLGILAMMLAFAPAAPARASLSDCINAALPIGDAAAAADLAGRLSACAAQASDPVAAVVAASIVALVTAGVIPSNTDQCDSVLDSVVGKLVAQALIDAGLGDAFGSGLLQNIAEGSGSLTNVPGLGELLSCGCTIAGAPGEVEAIANNYMGNVEGCLDFFADAGTAVLDGAEDVVCYGVLLGLGCAPAGGGDNTCYASFSCPYSDCPQGPTETWAGMGTFAQDPNVVCNTPGYQCVLTGAWGACSSIPHAIGVIPGRCTCQPPYTGRYVHMSETATSICPGITRDWLYECSCDAPNVMINGVCSCPPPLVLKNGVCQPCSDGTVWGAAPGVGGTATSCIVCLPGTKPDETHAECVPDCDAGKAEYFDNGSCQQCPLGAHVVYANASQQGGPGHCEANCNPGQVFAPDLGKCVTCAANARAVYDGAGSSAGHCEGCPDGTFSNGDATTCQPLNCGPSAYVDPDNQHACKSCPLGQIYYPQGSATITEPNGHVVGLPAHCGCPQGKQLVDGQCQCPGGSVVAYGGGPGAGCHCPIGAHIDDASWSCQCPAGATLNAAGNRCMCPAGQQLVDGVCGVLAPHKPPGTLVAPSAGSIPPLRKPPANCPALGPDFIRNPRDSAACLKCPAGRVANPAGTICMLAPREPATRVPPSAQQPPTTREPAVLVPPKAQEPSARQPPVIQEPSVREPPTVKEPIVRQPPLRVVPEVPSGPVAPRQTPEPEKQPEPEKHRVPEIRPGNQG